MRILITGSSGLLGSKLVAAAEAHDVIPTYCSRALFPVSIRMDITDRNEVIRIVEKHKPNVIIHTAAETNVDKCEVDRERAWKVNVEGTKNIVDVCVRNNILLVLLSTDYVFDGEKGLYTEEDNPNPINFYGYTKLEAERYAVQAEHLIIRTSVLYGWHPWKKNFVTWVLSSLREGKQIRVVEDHYNSPTLVDNLAELIIAAIEKDLRGLYNIAGSERISRLEFARKICEVFNLNPELIQRTRMSEFKDWIARRPRDSSLKVEKIQNAVRKRPLSVLEGLRLMRDSLAEA